MTTAPQGAELERQLADQRDKNMAAWRRINELEAMLAVRAADRKSLAARDERIRELEQQLAATAVLVPLAEGTRDEACLRCHVCRVAIPTRCTHCELLDLREGERHGG